MIRLLTVISLLFVSFSASAHHSRHSHYFHWDYYHSRPSVIYVYPAPPPPPAVIYIQPLTTINCQQYQRQIVVDNQIQFVYGTACLQPDGVWRIVN